MAQMHVLYQKVKCPQYKGKMNIYRYSL